MIQTVLFDLDGTLLPMDIEVFIKAYIDALGKKFHELGYDAKHCVKCVLAGTKSMYKNDGSVTNETCFWNTFEAISGIKRSECEEKLNSFYRDVFPHLTCCEGRCDNMLEALAILKEKGYRLVLATNPLFPALATKARIGWAELNEEDFDLVTTYDNCHYTKPNVGYYKEVLETINEDISSCLMVGNDSSEDGAIEQLGIPVYLVTDYLIHREETPLTATYQGTSEEFLAFVKAMPVVK